LASVDTNVLVRALTDDDTSQTAKVRQLMHRADLRNERLYVPLTVTLELEWVLRSSYRYAKEHVLQVTMNTSSKMPSERTGDTLSISRSACTWPA